MIASRISVPAKCCVFMWASFCLAGEPWVPIETGPDGWQAQASREEIAPTFHVDKETKSHGAYSLSITSTGNAAAQGLWAKSFDVRGGQPCRFTARYLAKAVVLERRSIFARVVFLNEAGRMIGQAEYPATAADATGGGWKTIRGDYVPDAKVRSARVELWFQWSERGSVWWDDVSLEPGGEVRKRIVKIASAQFHPGRKTKGAEENREFYAGVIEKVAAARPDVILLGEGITMIDTGQSYVNVAEPLPGPTSRRLGELSKRYSCYIVAGIYERVGKIVYNTAILTGPAGELVGRYRKLCLPREEYEGGVTPGSEYPVFETRFGKVGLMICWDIHFPEVARRLAINGAELILVPIWGGNELLVRARAVENQVFVATSSYYDKLRTAVWDRRGDPLAATNQWGQFVVAEVDLNSRTQWEWLGDFGARIPRERPVFVSE